MRPFIGWSATVVITLGRSRMGSSCPLLSSPTGNDPAFPKLAFLAHSHAGGHGAPFGLAITESLLPEKAIHLSRNTVPPGSNCYRLRHGKGFPVWKPLSTYNGHFFSKTWYCQRKISENLSTLLSESASGFVPCFALSTFQRTEICRLLSMPVRKILLCWLRELVAVRAVFKTLRGDGACKALSLGEVAAAVRLRIAGFGEGTPQQDSDGTE